MDKVIAFLLSVGFYLWSMESNNIWLVTIIYIISVVVTFALMCYSLSFEKTRKRDYFFSFLMALIPNINTVMGVIIFRNTGLSRKASDYLGL